MSVSRDVSCVSTYVLLVASLPAVGAAKLVILVELSSLSDIPPSAVIAPDTSKDVNVPTEVILGCEAFVTVPAVVAVEALPVRSPVTSPVTSPVRLMLHYQ